MRGAGCQSPPLLLLAPDILQEILFLPRARGGRDPIPEKAVRPIAAVPDFRKHRGMWRDMKAMTYPDGGHRHETYCHTIDEMSFVAEPDNGTVKKWQSDTRASGS